jgi:D-lyxose ketol-isomerase
MKRSEINAIIREADDFIRAHGMVPAIIPRTTAVVPQE